MVLGVAPPAAMLALVGVRPAHLRGDCSHERLMARGQEWGEGGWMRDG